MEWLGHASAALGHTEPTDNVSSKLRATTRARVKL